MINEESVEFDEFTRNAPNITLQLSNCVSILSTIF